MSTSTLTIDISSDDDEENSVNKPKLPKLCWTPPVTTDMGDEDDDDCVILDSDPFKAVVPVTEEYSGCGELVVVAEKCQLVACRDYPHARHLCVKFPFSTTLHVTHCDLCYCYVCDSPAPCVDWGTGVTDYNHCNATEKREIWKILRRRNNSKKRKSTSTCSTATPSLPASLRPTDSLEGGNDGAGETKPGLVAAPTPYEVILLDPKPDVSQKIDQVSKRKKSFGTWSLLNPPNVGNSASELLSTNQSQSCSVGTRNHNANVLRKDTFAAPMFKRVGAGGVYLPAKRSILSPSGLLQCGGSSSSSMAASSGATCKKGGFYCN